MQLEFGFLPPSFDRAFRNAQDDGCLFLGQAFVKKKSDDFLLLILQLVHMLVELAPHTDVIGFFCRAMEGATQFIRRLMVCVVVGTSAFRAEMMLFEIKQFPSDLDSSQVEKVPNRLHCDACQGTVKSDE